MPKSLGLADSLDVDDLLADVEATFDVRFEPDELRYVQTVGDIHDLLIARHRQADGACMTSMAFYRLRRALRAQRPDVELRPTTPLVDLASGNPKRLFARVSAETGLRMPSGEGGWLSVIGLLLLPGSLAAVVAAAIAEPVAWGALAVSLFAAGVLAFRFDPRVVPEDCRTLGDLARVVARMNFGKLTKEGGAVRLDALWTTLAGLLARHADIPSGDIDRDALLMA